MNTIKLEKQRIIDEMNNYDPDSIEHKNLRSALLDLSQVENMGLSLMNPNVLGSVTQVLGMLLIMNYEKLGIITTKAFSLIKIRK